MGLTVSHGCYDGGYGGFMMMREGIAHAAGVPLLLMEGFYKPPYQPSVEWAMPREGGPLCHDANGPMLYNYIERVTEWLPIKWESLDDDIVLALLNHSDTDGEIAAEDCAPLADRLAELLPRIPDALGNWPKDEWRKRTQVFVDGLRFAAERGEAVEFY